MLEIFVESPLWAFFICFFGALFTWFAAEQFRDQLLADSHQVVRQVALRYLQILIGAFSVFAVGMLLAIIGMLQGLFSTTVEAFEPRPTSAIIAATERTDGLELSDPPQSTSIVPIGGEVVSTARIDAPPPDPTIFVPEPTATPEPLDTSLTTIQTALIVNTNGLGVNVRELPSIGGAVLQVAPEGTRVTVLGDTQDADSYKWYKVVLPNGVEGWIANLFLSFDSQ